MAFGATVILYLHERERDSEWQLKTLNQTNASHPIKCTNTAGQGTLQTHFLCVFVCVRILISVVYYLCRFELKLQDYPVHQSLAFKHSVHITFIFYIACFGQHGYQVNAHLQVRFLMQSSIFVARGVASYVERSKSVPLEDRSLYRQQGSSLRFRQSL